MDTECIFVVIFVCHCIIIHNCLKVRIVGKYFGGGVVCVLVVLVAVSLLGTAA